jgi:hypothetical protein
MRVKSAVGACAIAFVAAAATPAAASAAPTKSASLACGRDGSYAVTGFGRGDALHLTTDASNFVVVYGENRDTGQVLMDAPGQRTRDDILTCTVTSPVTGMRLLLEGFLTPRA